MGVHHRGHELRIGRAGQVSEGHCEGSVRPSALQVHANRRAARARLIDFVDVRRGLQDIWRACVRGGKETELVIDQSCAFLTPHPTWRPCRPAAASILPRLACRRRRSDAFGAPTLPPPRRSCSLECRDGFVIPSKPSACAVYVIQQVYKLYAELLRLS